MGRLKAIPATVAFIAAFMGLSATSSFAGGSFCPFAAPGFAWVRSIDFPENQLRVRSGPGMAFPIVGYLQLHETVTTTGAVTPQNWAQITRPVCGWVTANQLSCTTTVCAPSPPPPVRVVRACAPAPIMCPPVRCYPQRVVRRVCAPPVVVVRPRPVRVCGWAPPRCGPVAFSGFARPRWWGGPRAFRGCGVGWGPGRFHRGWGRWR